MSYARKRLVWQSGELEVTLPPQGAADFITVAVGELMGQNFGGDGIRCELQPDAEFIDLSPVYGYFATPEAMTPGGEIYDDYLCAGCFLLELEVQCHEGKHTKAHVRLELNSEMDESTDPAGHLLARTPVSKATLRPASTKADTQ